MYTGVKTWRGDDGRWQFCRVPAPMLVYTIDFVNGIPVATATIDDKEVYPEKIHVQVRTRPLLQLKHLAARFANYKDIAIRSV